LLQQKLARIIEDEDVNDPESCVLPENLTPANFADGFVGGVHTVDEGGATRSGHLALSPQTNSSRFGG
jgi:hypothetical protein